MGRKIVDENADFDYGTMRPKQKNVSIRPHDFRSGPDGKVRYVGNYADNAMFDPAKVNEGAQDSMLERLHNMLGKAKITDDEIVSGVRLNQRGRQKAAAALGISVHEVDLLLNSLKTHLRKVQKWVNEAREILGDGTPRFSHEEDYLGNVTIRDGKTGKEAFLRGSQAAKLLADLKAGGDDQDVLSRYASVMEADHWSEEDPEREAPHWEAKRQTGFYGAQAAGCVVLARSTGRILLAHRSAMVDQPGTWGNWGGAIDRGEDPKEAAVREVQEEAGYRGEIIAVEPLYVFAKGTFRYFNFLVVVPDEFKPRLNWEADGAKWCEVGQWPQPLHFGLAALFDDGVSMDTIRSFAEMTEAVMESLDDTINIVESILNEDNFDDEIRSSGGSFNFPWKANGRSGFATASYKGRGPAMTITVVSIRDRDGDEVEDVAEIDEAVHDQAVAFIGRE